MLATTKSAAILAAEGEACSDLGTKAAQRAFAMAGKGPADVQVAEVHDCFTIAEIMAYEDLGFCRKGEGGRFIADRHSYIGGKVAVNVDGGLKAKDVMLALMTSTDSARLISGCAISLQDYRDPERFRGYLWVMGPLLKGAGSLLFAALAAFYRRTPVAHVEAGLRTGDLYSPFPEEANRVLAGRLTTLHFPPTERASSRLRRSTSCCQFMGTRWTFLSIQS